MYHMCVSTGKYVKNNSDSVFLPFYCHPSPISPAACQTGSQRQHIRKLSSFHLSGLFVPPELPSLTSRLSMTSSLTQRMNMFSPWLSFSLLRDKPGSRG